MKKICLIILASLLIISSSFASEQKLTIKEAKQIAKEAYIYGFPLVLNYKTMYDYAVDKKSPDYKGDFNKLACVARVFTPEDKTIVDGLRCECLHRKRVYRWAQCRSNGFYFDTRLQ